MLSAAHWRIPPEKLMLPVPKAAPPLKLTAPALMVVPLL